MSDAIGALHAFVTLQQPTRVADELGGAAISWTDAGSLWCAIEAGGGGDGQAYDTARSVTSYRVGVRRRDDVRAGWRVVWGARVFRIVGVRDDGGPRMELICEEEVL